MTPRIQRWLEAAAMRLAPRLPRLMRRGLTAIETLEMRAADNAARAESHQALEILSELDAAVALADGAPWLPPTGQPPTSRAAEGLVKARESITAVVERESKSVGLRETVYGMAELELALEDRGWKRLIAQSQYEFSRFGIQSIILICRLYKIKHPLASRGVDVSAFYVFGRGFEISSNDPDANEVLQAFFNDPRNASQLSHTALVKKEAATYTDGNLFWVMFSDPTDGQTLIRGISALEISDIITDPEDSETPWFYRRDWMESTLDDRGDVTARARTAWYVALGYEDMPNFPKNLRVIQTFPVFVDRQGEPVPMMHLKDGGIADGRFGCPRMYPALDWLRAYRKGLEDLCTTWRALARFVWNVETSGGAPAIAALKNAFATTLANDLSQIETNPPPVTGSAFISGPTQTISPISTAGATMNPDNLRRVLLMVCAAFGIGEHLMGDATTGSLATAASLERPTELMFYERQEVWREQFQRFGHYALSRSLKAPGGKLRESVARRRGVKPAQLTEAHLRSVKLRMAPVIRESQSPLRKEGAVSRATRADGASPSARTDKSVDITEAGSSTEQTDEITIQVSFPDILAHDITSRVNAIVEAMTLGGYSATGIDMKVGIGLLLSELGVENPQEVSDAMFPEEGDNPYDPDRTKEPPPPQRITGKEQIPDTDPGTDPAPAPPAPKAKESRVSSDPIVIARAVAQLKRALKLQEARIKRGPGGAA